MDTSDTLPHDLHELPGLPAEHCQPEGDQVKKQEVEQKPSFLSEKTLRLSFWDHESDVEGTGSGQQGMQEPNVPVPAVVVPHSPTVESPEEPEQIPGPTSLEVSGNSGTAICSGDDSEQEVIPGPRALLGLFDAAVENDAMVVEDADEVTGSQEPGPSQRCPPEKEGAPSSPRTAELAMIEKHLDLLVTVDLAQTASEKSMFNCPDFTLPMPEGWNPEYISPKEQTESKRRKGKGTNEHEEGEDEKEEPQDKEKKEPRAKAKAKARGRPKSDTKKNGEKTDAGEAPKKRQRKKADNEKGDNKEDDEAPKKRQRKKADNEKGDSKEDGEAPKNRKADNEKEDNNDEAEAPKKRRRKKASPEEAANNENENTPGGQAKSSKANGEIEKKEKASDEANDEKASAAKALRSKKCCAYKKVLTQSLKDGKTKEEARQAARDAYKITTE